MTIVELKALDEIDYLYLNSLGYRTNQTEYIEVLRKYIQEGGDIDFYVNDHGYRRPPGTILFRSLVYGHDEVIKFVLDHGADITIKCPIGFDSWNSLEYAILTRFNQGLTGQVGTYELIKKNSLEKFASNGLHQIHLDSATGLWFEVLKKLNNEPDLLSKTIDTNSPLWPGMTPLLLAARFYRTDIVKGLLDIGASPKERDIGGNTPLHYLITPRHLIGVLTHKNYFGDERLFIYDEEDTFGNYNGLSHFHISILPYSSNVNEVETYLRLGVSPNLEVRKNNFTKGFATKNVWTAFDLLLKRDTENAIKILNLLLEYGADPDRSCRHCRKTPLENYLSSNKIKVELLSEFLCPLLEVGANSDIQELDSFIVKMSFNNGRVHLKHEFLKCVKRMLMINEVLVSKRLYDGYEKVLNHTESFNETDYGMRCQQELKILNKQGLRPVLDHSQVIKVNFKNSFGHLVESSDFTNLYKIYGKIVKVKLRRRLIEFERKKKKIEKAVPFMFSLGSQIIKNQHFNPDCAECILWYFNEKELDYFIEQHDIPETVSKSISASKWMDFFSNFCKIL